MADFRKMTVETLRELARKVLGPGQSRKTKSELVEALEAAQKAAGKAAEKAAPAAKRAGAKTRAVASRTARRTEKVVRAVKQAGKAAEEGARAAAKAGKSAAASVAQDVRAAAKARKPRATGNVAKVAASIAGAAAGVVAGVAAGVSAVRARRRKVGNGRPGGAAPDPEGYFVARVRGEEAVREAPHSMTETAAESPESFRAVLVEELVEGGEGFEEGLGELPWGYGDDAFVALPRDPRTLFLYWDFARETAAAAFAGFEHPRVELQVLVRTDAGWDPVRTADFALESRGFYVHDLEPGRVYRAEIHAVDRRGQRRLLGRGSNEMMLPPLGPSPVIDDRFIRIAWEVPLGRLLGPGHGGGPFSEEARALLARLSDWSRFSSRPGAGSAGGLGGRPTSPGVSSPSSPFGRFGPGEGS